MSNKIPFYSKELEINVLLDFEEDSEGLLCNVEYDEKDLKVKLSYEQIQKIIGTEINDVLSQAIAEEKKRLANE